MCSRHKAWENSESEYLPINLLYIQKENVMLFFVSYIFVKQWSYLLSFSRHSLCYTQNRML